MLVACLAADAQKAARLRVHQRHQFFHNPFRRGTRPQSRCIFKILFHLAANIGADAHDGKGAAPLDAIFQRRAARQRKAEADGRVCPQGGPLFFRLAGRYAVHGLKCAVKCRGRGVAITQSHIGYLAAVLQFFCGQRHFSAPEVLGQGHTGHIGKHALEVKHRTARNAGRGLHIRRLRQVIFQKANCLVKTLRPIHCCILPVCCDDTILPHAKTKSLSFSVRKKRGFATFGRLRPAAFV